MSQKDTKKSAPRLITLQFSFANGRFVPGCLPVRSVETTQQHGERSERGSGEMIVEPTLNTSLVPFIDDLASAGYELVDAFYQSRVGGNNRAYQCVRFMFAKSEHAHSSDAFKKDRDEYLDALYDMVEQAMWRVRVFDNPFYAGGEVVEGERSLSVNLEVRTPLFQPNGEPIVVWERDEAGEKVGDQPLPLEPDYVLRLNGSMPVINKFQPEA